jgi:cytochrome b
MVKKISRECLIWDVPTRIFHWSLALAFAMAYLTGDEDRWALFHVTAGYTILGLLTFRIVWGFTGSCHARFSSFIKHPREILHYLASLTGSQKLHYAGHNPAGGWVILILLLLGLTVTITGVLEYEDVEWPMVEQIHEWSAAIMLGFVVIHILGVVVSSLLHRENLIRAMITGCKPGCESAAIETPYRWLGWVLLILIASLWLWLFKDRLPIH